MHAPLYVSAGADTVRAVDWSLGGLRLENYPGDVPPAGTAMTLQLTLPFQGFDVSFGVDSEVVRGDAMAHMFAVRFTSLGARARELMAHFLEELVRGSMASAEDTIQRIDVPVTPASLEPYAPRGAAIPLRRRPFKALAMSAVYLALGTIVFGYAFLLGYASFFHLEVQTAVISAPVETVAAHADGRLSWTGYRPGDVVRSGDVILSIFDNRLEREIENADIAVQERRARLGYAKRRHAEEQERVEGFASVESKNVAQARLELASLDAQLHTAEQQLSRVRHLHGEGFATAVRLEEAERIFATLKASAESRRLEFVARTELAGRNLGKRLYNGENLVGNLAELEAEVWLAENEVQLAEQRLRSATEQRTRSAIRAPFDGTILDLPRVDQAAVRPGDMIAIIEQRRDRRVSAFLTQDEVLKVGLGDEAAIYVPALRETFKGRVRQIDRTSGFVRELGERQVPGYRWRAPTDRSAMVIIDFEDRESVQDIERYRAGLPVVVVFERRSAGTVLGEVAGALTSRF